MTPTDRPEDHGLDTDDLRARAAAWVWVPADARVAHADDYLLVGYGPWFADPTQAFRLDSARPAAALVDDVLDVAASWGRPWVTFCGLHDRTRPRDLEEHLRTRGAELVEEYAVVARSLVRGLPDLDPPGDVVVRRVLDLATRRDLDRVDVAVFGGQPQSEEELAASLEQVRGEVAAPRFVAYRDDVAVGSGGCTLAADGPRASGGGPGSSGSDTDPVDTVRLWGGGVLEEHRGSGVYRALLDHRLRVGAAAGAEVALVKGRLTTSAPVLRRAGFVDVGRERCWRLATRAAPGEGASQ